MPISRLPMWTRTKGFTFVELAIAIVVISILMTLVAVNWGPMLEKGKQTFLDRFAMEVAVLREEAVSNFQQRAMEFNITENTIRVGAIDLVKGFDPLRQVPLPEGYSVKETIINGKKITMGKTYVLFYPSGLLDKAILHIEESKDFSSIIINPLTAKVEIKSGYVEEVSLPERTNPS
jgi:prepilin-type N-terminal cleavage/methylation domain-containing protein